MSWITCLDYFLDIPFELRFGDTLSRLPLDTFRMQRKAQLDHLRPQLSMFRSFQHPPHLSRTLDQFYYSSLADTTLRDFDQTISKWTGDDIGEEGKSVPTSDSLLVMVDQLWCWVLDDSRSR